ncbi:MAG: hypothetical protein AAF485_14420, partial [Chloroflexota bacterium]
MADWEVILDDGDFEETSDEVTRLPNRWRWVILAGGIIIFLLGVGYFTLDQRRLAGRAALRDDLTTLILIEETERALGNYDYALDLMLPTASDTWQFAYQQTFEIQPPIPNPDNLDLGEEIAFDGVCAVADVRLFQHNQVRRYCITDQGWRRAPVSSESWGEVQMVRNLRSDVLLRFYPRDEAFAQQVAIDFEQFYTDLEAWGLLEDRGHTELPTDQSLEIMIQPQDLLSPLMEESAAQIVVNSPKLTPIGEGDIATANPSDDPAETMLRQILLETILRRSEAFRVASYNSLLPGQSYFLEAMEATLSQDVVAPSEQANVAQREVWINALDGRWVSPFVVQTTNDFSEKSEVTAQLIVDYIYRTQGSITLGELLYRLPTTNSWDELFEETLNRKTIDLESDVLADLETQFGQPLTRIFPSGRWQPPTVPFGARILRVEEGVGGGKRIFTALSGRINGLVVEVAHQIPVQTRDGHPIPPGCLPPGSPVSVAGNWLERPWRLQAEQLTVEALTPLRLRRPSADTIAFIVDDEVSSEQTTILNDVLLSSQLSSVQSPLPQARALFALNSDGRLHRMASLRDHTRVFALPIAAGDPARLLFTIDLPTCDRSWFVLYEMGTGVVGQWLGRPNPLQWVWRPDHQDILLFVPRGGGRGFEIFKTGDTLALEPVSRTFAPFVYLGWSLELQQPINALDWFDTTYIGVTNLTTGGLDR